MQASIRLFGQGTVEDLLRLYGKPATARELYDFMIKNHGQVITYDMLVYALTKGCKRGTFRMINEKGKSDSGYLIHIRRYTFA